MVAETFIAAILLVAIVAFLLGEQYGRSRERIVRDRLRDRRREEQIETRTLRDLAWDGEEAARG